ncbi:MAG TPA: 16S rRNA (guanine(527)-N(7))-methyltransferase RsmG [Saprospiraceae bacterium]|nr:16S rRNA (guanine(527)-N(7))-methyltransferase RsmG [Saprospiraceae bacterium]
MDEILKYFPKLSETQGYLLKTYSDRLIWWNARINLISRQDTENVVLHHILHSLAIAKCFQFPPGTRILDLGTGGGLPGIPLAIYFPDCTFTLIDSRGKKIKAVRSIIEELHLRNVKAIHARAEEFDGEFDFVVTRAVATLTELIAWTKHYFRKGEAGEVPMTKFGEGGAIRERGLIVLKGGDLKKETETMGKMGKAGEVGKKVHFLPIYVFFPEPYFLEKFIVFIPITWAPVSPILPVTPD